VDERNEDCVIGMPEHLRLVKFDRIIRLEPDDDKER
jgi:hypothetical protein